MEFKRFKFQERGGDCVTREEMNGFSWDCYLLLHLGNRADEIPRDNFVQFLILTLK